MGLCADCAFFCVWQGVLDELKPHHDKIRSDAHDAVLMFFFHNLFSPLARILLNKADSLDQQTLLRVYGALMWSLGKVIRTPEVSCEQAIGFSLLSVDINCVCDGCRRCRGCTWAASGRCR